MDKAVNKSNADSKRNPKTRSLDHLTKNVFLHQQLHEFLAIAAKIEEIKGETLDWELNLLGISNLAWNKIIHRGIKPIIVFPHPVVLKTILGAVEYYRMIAMAHKESMTRVRWMEVPYESGESLPDKRTAAAIAMYLNQIISRLIELDEQIDAREFDLWRGVTVGSQAQCSWQSKSNRRRKQA